VTQDTSHKYASDRERTASELDTIDESTDVSRNLTMIID
jgi:hypothetical protein